MRPNSTYAYELWSSSGSLLADLSGIATNRRFSRSRNEPDTISFTLDFDQFHTYCEQIHVHPRALIVPGQTEVRVRRRDKYMCGGQINIIEPTISAGNNRMTVRAVGFGDVFGQRYVPYIKYSAQDVGDIAWSLIDNSQLQPYGDIGVTRGLHPTIALANHELNQITVKDALNMLANSESRGFDMDFTYDKIFNIYEYMGSDLPGVLFEYPGNIRTIRAPYDATRIANDVVVIGSGTGSSASLGTATDTESQSIYGLRQKIMTMSNQDDSLGNLTEVANTYKAAWSKPFEITELEINGNAAPFVGSYDIGDRIRVSIRSYKWFDGYDGMSRIEKYSVDIDDDDNEAVTVALVQI